MFAQQVSKTLPLLVAVSIVSAIAGAVLAQPGQDNWTACTTAAPGGANRTFDCQKWTGCRAGPQGQCLYGENWISPAGGSNPTELYYDYCKSYHLKAECVWDETQSACLQYLGWVTDSTCKKGDTCTGLVYRQDCHTDF